MWLILALLSVLSYASSDLFGKKDMDSGRRFAYLELLIAADLLAFLLGVALHLSGVGESGQAPWQLLYAHPLIALNLCCYLLCWLFSLLSMRYLKLAVIEAFSGAVGVFYFVGLVAVNLICGKLAAVRDMLHPGRLVPILLVLTFVCLLPNTERRDGISRAETKAGRKRILLGLCFLAAALLFDSLDSLLTTLILGEGNIGSVDYLMSSWSAALVPLLLFSLILLKKTRRLYIPFRRGDPYSLPYALPALLSSVLYAAASSLDAVRTGILFTAYPIIPILGAKLFLHEKYTWRQKLCIRIITGAAIAFCIADYLL